MHVCVVCVLAVPVELVMLWSEMENLNHLG